MELLDYARFRWKPLTVLLVLGLLVIGFLAVGGLAPRDQYVARAELLVRPPASQLSVFGFDPDRFVQSEIATITSDSGLEAEAKGTSLTPDELKSALTVSHTQGSDIVTVGVQTEERKRSMSIANRVADNYLDRARTRSESLNESSITFLERRLDTEQASLTQANRRLSRASNRLSRSDSGIGAIDPLLLSPTDYSQQQTALDAVQQTQQQLSQLKVTSRGELLSRVVNPAEDAERAAQPLDPTTILAAVVGLVLLIVVIAAVALSFSRRVVSAARWNSATGDARLRPAIRGRAGAQTADNVRRIVRGITNVGGSGPVALVAFPAESKRTASTVQQLERSLENSGVACAVDDWQSQSRVPVPASADNGHVPNGAPVLAVVDLATCRIDDALLIADCDPTFQRRVIPVLV